MLRSDQHCIAPSSTPPQAPFQFWYSLRRRQTGRAAAHASARAALRRPRALRPLPWSTARESRRPVRSAEIAVARWNRRASEACPRYASCPLSMDPRRHWTRPACPILIPTGIDRLLAPCTRTEPPSMSLSRRAPRSRSKSARGDDSPVSCSYWHLLACSPTHCLGPNGERAPCRQCQAPSSTRSRSPSGFERGRLHAPAAPR